METNDTSVPTASCAPSTAIEQRAVLEAQVADSLRLYRVAQADIDATLRCGLLPTSTQQRARYMALQSYHACVRMLQAVSSAAGGSEGNVGAAIDTPDEDAYRLLSDDTLARIAAELETATNDQTDR